jgi:hypothetical protein
MQLMSQSPQCSSSELRFEQPVSQNDSPGPHSHTPLKHLPSQSTSQRPQCCVSVLGSTQISWQRICDGEQTHAASEQD